MIASRADHVTIHESVQFQHRSQEQQYRFIPRYSQK